VQLHWDGRLSFRSDPMKGRRDGRSRAFKKGIVTSKEHKARNQEYGDWTGSSSKAKESERASRQPAGGDM